MFAEHATYALVIKMLSYVLKSVRSESASRLKFAGCLFCRDISTDASSCFYIHLLTWRSYFYINLLTWRECESSFNTSLRFEIMYLLYFFKKQQCMLRQEECFFFLLLNAVSSFTEMRTKWAFIHVTTLVVLRIQFLILHNHPYVFH